MSFFLRKKNWYGIFHPYQKVYTRKKPSSKFQHAEFEDGFLYPKNSSLMFLQIIRIIRRS